MSYVLQTTIFLFSILVAYFVIMANENKEYFKNNNMNLSYKNLNTFPEFATSQSIFNNVFTKIQAAKNDDEGLIILPLNASEINTILGFPTRSVLTNQSFKKRLDNQKEQSQNEQMNTLEYVPFLWYCQDKLFQEYRKYFTEVECLKYYHNIFKTSRKMKKPKTLQWHKDNCDITLDLNNSVEEGEDMYTGIDGITARLKLSNMGRD